jgi:hypothetical protein
MQPTSTQATTSAQAQQNLQNYSGQMQTPDQLMQQEQNNLGVGQAQQQVSGLRTAITNTTNLLNQVAPSVQGRTANSLVTSAQQTRQIGNEQAPISQQLSQQTQDYNTANANYTDLEGQASTLANADLSSENQQLNNLQNIYSDLYTQEQAAQQQQIQQQQFEQQQAEAEREFNASLGASSSANGSVGSELANILGNQNSGSLGATLGSQQRSGGGFNFQYNGQTINAGEYGALTQTPIRTVLQEMANKGDSGAKTALSFMGNDNKVDPTKITNQNLANLVYALTGQRVGVYNPNTKGSPSKVISSKAPVSTGIFGNNKAAYTF